MAEVNPSVSTAGSSLTNVLRLASSTLPSDKMTWVTVGSASGIAAMASENAATKRTSHASLRARPKMNITTMVSPAAATIHRVRVFSSLVSGDCSASVAESIPEIFPISDSAAVAVTIITPLPWVTGVFMKAMFSWSPGARSLQKGSWPPFAPGRSPR